LKKKQWILGVIVLVALAAVLFWGRDRIHFDFAVFRAQLAGANWTKIAIGLACIYLGYVFRAVRWALLLRHNKKVGLFSLLGTQVIGFTAIALIGRVADPVRPYLVSKKTGLTLSTQIAVYIVERLFDLGSMALIFSSVILFTVWFGQPGDLPHIEIVKKAGYSSMAIALAGAIFLVAVRMAGNMVAGFFESTLGLASKRLGRAAAEKVRSFHAGLDIMRSFSDFAITAGISIAMWLLIALAYLETMQGFTGSKELAAMTLPKSMLMLAFSGVASAFQLPIIGWFTQIGLVAAAIANFYGVGSEASTACAAMLLIVSFLAVIPIGLVWAQVDNISLRQITSESEKAEEVLEAETDPAAPEASEPAR
jgi:hypothetical protein